MQKKESLAVEAGREKGIDQFRFQYSSNNSQFKGSPLDVLLSRLSSVRSNGLRKHLARCPAHDDRSPSLSIRETDDGRVLVHCFGGCAVDDVLAAVGLATADLFSPRPAEQAYGKRAKVPKWSRGELFDLVITEALILALALHDLLLEKELSDGDFARVIQAEESVMRCATEVRHHG